MALFKLSSNPFKNFLLIVLLLSGAIVAFGQADKTRSLQSAKDLLPERLDSGQGPVWLAVTPARTFEKEQWSILPNADIHSEYGLRKMMTRQYRDGRSDYTVEIFEMGFASGAYGLFTFNRRSLAANRREFVVGRLMVSIAGDNPDPAVISALEKSLANDSGPLPFLTSQLPSQNKIPGSETYLIGPAALAEIEPFAYLKEIVDFTGGVQIATAAYLHAGGQMNLMIVEYNTPQSASDGVARAKSRFESLSADEKLSRLVKRTGNYLIEVSGIRNKPEVEQMVGKIKYSPRVTWEGTRITNIPWQYRPPDPAALEEASETAMMLIRTFYWIGILLVGSILTGVITGGSFFYYRRYRRRKLGIDDIFSDPGETVRLNLDDYLIESGKKNINKTGSRNE